MDSKAKGLENGVQNPQEEQHQGWIWRYFTLRGHEPWSGLQTHRLAGVVVSKGSSNHQASDMQELNEYFDAITHKQVVKDAIAYHDGMLVLYTCSNGSDTA